MHSQSQQQGYWSRHQILNHYSTNQMSNAKIPISVPEQLFQGMTTSAVITLVRALEAQQSPRLNLNAHCSVPPVHLAMPGILQNHSLSKNTLRTSGLPSPLLARSFDLLPGRIISTPKIAHQQSVVKSARKNVKHSFKHRSSLPQPKPMAPPPRLPSLRPWQKVNKKMNVVKAQQPNVIPDCEMPH